MAVEGCQPSGGWVSGTPGARRILGKGWFRLLPHRTSALCLAKTRHWDLFKNSVVLKNSISNLGQALSTFVVCKTCHC